MGTSNRFRVVTDVVYDDFMQWERPLGVARVPWRLAAPPHDSHVPYTAIEQQGVSSVTNLEPGIQSATWGFYYRILRLRDWAQVSLLDAHAQDIGCSGRRHESPQGARGLARHPGVSPIA